MTTEELTQTALDYSDGDVSAARHALCDGDYLESLGLTDADTEMVECVYAALAESGEGEG